MDNKFYLDVIVIVIITLVLVVVLSALYNFISKKYHQDNQFKTIIKKTNNFDNLKFEPVNESENKKIIIIDNPNSLMPVESIMPPVPPGDDILTVYDKQVAFDPMVAPSRRPPRHVILPNVGNPYFNYPTRGFTDSYSLQGYLVKEHKDNHHRKLNTQINNPDDKDFNPKCKNDDQFDEHREEPRENQILKLFGREKFPNSTEYEYYVIVNTGFNDNIKYFLENVRKELYDGDNVYIDILKSKYRVKIMKERIFEYNPYFI